MLLSLAMAIYGTKDERWWGKPNNSEATISTCLAMFYGWNGQLPSGFVYCSKVDNLTIHWEVVFCITSSYDTSRIL